MSVESSRVTRAGHWAEWEHHVVNGVYPLRRFLGRSNHSAVFLTEYKAENLPNAAIKLVPADTVQAEALLVQWGTAATLSHPHLLRLFDMGRWQFGGRAFLFVVMEYADQTLAQILPRRALSPDEVKEMLAPTLDALAFVQRHSLVHGQLKPSNILVVGDQLKLASDTVRVAGNSATRMVRTMAYDAPEQKEGAVSAAGDVWSLGITLIEALTQRGPPWQDERSAIASLPPTLPPPLADTVWRCLIRNPAHRPTIAELDAEYRPAPPAPAAPPSPASEPAESESEDSQSVASEAPPEDAPRRKSSTWPLLLAATAAVVIISFAVWFDSRLPNSQQVASRAILTSSGPFAAGAAAADGGTPDDDTPTADELAAAQRAPEAEAAEPAAADGTAPGVAAPDQIAVGQVASAQVAPGQAAASNKKSADQAARERANVAQALAERVAMEHAAAEQATAERAALERAAAQRTAIEHASAVRTAAEHASTEVAMTQPVDSAPAAPLRVASKPAATPTPVASLAPGTPAAPATLIKAADVTSPRSRLPAPATLAKAAEVSSPPSRAAAPGPTQPSFATTDPASPVVHEEIPEIPPTIIQKVHGHVRVTVRVLVDPAGTVVGEFMESPGPSHYFAGVAGDAATKWQFTPTDARGARVWLLHFEFTRDGATVDAAAAH